MNKRQTTKKIIKKYKLRFESPDLEEVAQLLKQNSSLRKNVDLFFLFTSE